MVQQISLDAQMETVNSSFADFTQFPESVVEVKLHSFTQNVIKLQTYKFVEFIFQRLFAGISKTTKIISNNNRINGSR